MTSVRLDRLRVQYGPLIRAKRVAQCRFERLKSCQNLQNLNKLNSFSMTSAQIHQPVEIL